MRSNQIVVVENHVPSICCAQAPSEVRLLQVLLGPKHRGAGRRPIGRYCALPRVPGKHLTIARRQWDEQRGSHGMWSMTAGRAPTDSVWRQSVIAEGEPRNGGKVITLCRDLKSFYDY